MYGELTSISSMGSDEDLDPCTNPNHYTIPLLIRFISLDTCSGFAVQPVVVLDLISAT